MTVNDASLGESGSKLSKVAVTSLLMGVTRASSEAYAKRCEISHEGVLFLNDLDLYEQTNDEDWKLRLEVQQIARLALYNWLHFKH